MSHPPPGRPRRPAVFPALLLSLGVTASACAPGLLKATISVDPEANGNTPVSLSVIVVYEKAVVPKLMELSAKQWFQQREQFLRDHPKEMEENLWEFVPGQQVPPFNRKLKKAPKQGIIFANYRSPGTHRYLFDASRTAQLTLGQKGLALPP
jgi:type VI secretion system protein